MLREIPPRPARAAEMRALNMGVSSEEEEAAIA